MTSLADLAMRVCEEVGLPVAAAAGRAQTYILETYADVVQRARLNPATKNVTLSPGVSDYDLPVDLVLLRSARYLPAAGGMGDPLEQVAPVDARASLARLSTTPGYAGQYSIEGPTLIIVPTPNSGDSLVLDYDAQPATFGPEEQPPLLPLHLHDVLVWGGCTRDVTNHDIQRKAFYDQRYKTRLGDVVRWSSRRAGQRPRTAVLGRVGRRSYANDVYPGIGDC